MGKQDLIKHSKTQGHMDRARSLKTQSRLNFSSQAAGTNEAIKRTEAEVRMAVLTATCNVPFAFHDHLSPTIRAVFPDSPIASKYHSASTKAMCMLNMAIAPELKKELLDNMKVRPFSVSVDSSNDTELEKMNPMAIRIYNEKHGKIEKPFLDMCTSRSATAEAIYGVMNEKLSSLLGMENPWDRCTSVGVDNTSVNIGTQNSLKTRIVKRNSAIYFN